MRQIADAPSIESSQPIDHLFDNSNFSAGKVSKVRLSKGYDAFLPCPAFDCNVSIPNHRFAFGDKLTGSKASQ